MLPRSARRLFFAQGEALRDEKASDLVFARLLEDGDSDDLGWLTARVSEPVLTRWFAHRGGRALSRRSRAFWHLLLDREPASPPALTEELWPL